MNDQSNIVDILKSSFNKKLLYLVLALILIPLILIVVFKFTPKNRLISKLNSFKSEIDNCNLTLKDGINDKTINPSKSKDILSNGIQTLDSIKDDIDKIEVNEKYTDIKSTFKKALDYNIGLYEVSLSILKDPNSKDLKSKADALENNLNSFNESSKSLDLYGITYNLNQTSTVFFNNMKIYTNALLKITIQNDILDEQRRDFLIDLDKNLSTLKTISKDFKSSIESIKKDNRSLDVIIDEINKNKSTFSSIEKSSKNITIPSVGKEVFASLEETLKLYSLYIQELEYAVLADANASIDSSTDDINEKYNSAYSKYDDFINSLERLSEHISALKN
ncbi:MAG: hypothetical protein ACRC2K_04675 [Clostridium sp.]